MPAWLINVLTVGVNLARRKVSGNRSEDEVLEAHQNAEIILGSKPRSVLRVPTRPATTRQEENHPRDSNIRSVSSDDEGNDNDRENRDGRCDNVTQYQHRQTLQAISPLASVFSSVGLAPLEVEQI